MTVTDCICSIAVALGLACYLEGLLTHLNKKNPVLWYVLMALLVGGAVAVRCLVGNHVIPG